MLFIVLALYKFLIIIIIIIDLNTRKFQNMKRPTTTSKVSTTIYDNLKNIYSHSQTI